MKTAGAVVCAMLAWACACSGEQSLEGRNLLHLKSSVAAVIVDCGGAIVDFHLADQSINPFTWNYPEKGDRSPRQMGHFVCFDRVGNPSPSEQKNGMPFHGEAGHVEWTVLSQQSHRNGTIVAELQCELPIGGMRLIRTMTLSENTPVLTVREAVTNINKLGRVYNIVQHPSIAPPFLDDSVLVDSGAARGFWAGNPMPTPEEPVVYWPEIIYKGELVDLRRLAGNPDPGVVNFIFPDNAEYGWVTACNPGKQLLVGYLWKLSDYPWLRIWRSASEGRPLARGLEFGTTPLPFPFGVILAKGSIYGHPIYEYLDAGQTVEKSYIAFLAKIPADYTGVADIQYKDNRITLKEQGTDKQSRTIVVSMQ